MISIRPEKQTDREAIRKLTEIAFANSDMGHNGEADLVDVLRDNCDFVSMVAVSDHIIVGHILFSPVTIRGRNGEHQGMGLAPMAVSPKHQNRGIGTSLIRSGLAHLTENGCPFVVVVGNPEYYSRFGFVPAAQYRVSHGFSEIPQNVFLINLLSDDELQLAKDCKAYYRPEFGPQFDE